jgi:hypothetical protein
VHLSAVVDLVLEEVGEHVGDPFGGGNAREHDARVERRLREAPAVGDEAPIPGDLLGAQRIEAADGVFRPSPGWAAPPSTRVPT